jgi:hypothetical protein
VLKILLNNSGNSPNLGFAYGLLLMDNTIYPPVSTSNVKTAKTRRKPVGVRSLHTSVASQRLHAGDPTPKTKFILCSKSLKNPSFIKSVSINFMQKNQYSYLSATQAANSYALLSPYYITGISDGESSFIISILKNKNYKSGYQIQAKYAIQLHIKDLVLLNKLQSFLAFALRAAGQGVEWGLFLLKKVGNSAIFSVQSLKDLSNVVIPHFDKYPLLTKKRADYLLFKNIVNLMVAGSHLSKQGIENILSIKASMNKGLSSEFRQQYPHIIPVKRPEVK